MNVNAVLRKFYVTKKSILKQLRDLQTTLEDVALQQRRAKREKQLRCTPQIARQFGIPKLKGSKKEILNRNILDILPPLPRKGQRRATRGLVARLRWLVHVREPHLLIGEYALMTPEQLMPRTPNSQTITLFRQCLMWNGLDLGMNFNPNILDQRVMQTIPEFLKDVPSPTRESLLSKLKDITTTGKLCFWSKGCLMRQLHLTEDEVAILQTQLVAIGRSLDGE